MSDLAKCLLLRPHSATELIRRAEAAGFVRRTGDNQDARVVRVELTPEGERLVGRLTQAHLAALHKLAEALADLVAVAG